MPETKQQLRYQWIQPIIDKKISISDVLKVCPFSERTIKYWLHNFKKERYVGLLDDSTRPNTSPNKTPDWIEREVLRVRERQQFCGKKIHWELEKMNINIHERTINKILKRNDLTKVYRHRKDYIYKKKHVTIPGKILEIDIKYGIHFGFGRWWYQYTAVDVASRWRFLYGFENKENGISIEFVNKLIDKTRPMFNIEAIKTDNDSVFTNRFTGYTKSIDPLNIRYHDFDNVCKKHDIVHYLIDPGKPTQNGTVERSHRSDQQYFYNNLDPIPKTVEEYNYKLRLWNNWYNDLPHCSLNGLSPNEYLEKVQYVRS